MYDAPQDPSLWSSKVISALLGPSTAIDSPPAPASRVHMLNSAVEAHESKHKGKFAAAAGLQLPPNRLQSSPLERI